MALGNVNPSTLVKNARSAYEKRRRLEDRIQAHQFNISSKTEEDTQQYIDHLRQRMETTADPGDQLTFQKRIVSARRTHTSHKIQRTAIDILEGNQDLEDKRNTVGQLYRTAVSNNDMDLAQSLRSQYDRLDVQLQKEREREAEKAQVWADKMARARANSFEEYAEKLIEGDFGDEMNRQGQFSLKEMNELLKKKGTDYVDSLVGDDNKGYWDFVHDRILEVSSAYQQAAQFTTSDSKKIRLLEKAREVRNGEADFEVVPGQPDLSIKEVEKAMNIKRTGQNLYRDSSDENGNTIFKEKVLTGYAIGRHRDGTYERIKVFDAEPNRLEVESRDDPVTMNSQEVVSKIEDAGWDVVESHQDHLLVQVPPGVDIPGTPAGKEVRMTLNRQGKFQFVNEEAEGDVFEFDVDTGEVREMTFEEDFSGGRFDVGEQEEIDRFNDLLQETKRQQQGPLDRRTPSRTEELFRSAQAVDNLNDANITGVGDGVGSPVSGLLLQNQAAENIRDERERMERAAKRAVEEAERSSQGVQDTQDPQGRRQPGQDRIQGGRERARRNIQGNQPGHGINQIPGRDIGRIPVTPPDQDQQDVTVREPDRDQDRLRVDNNPDNRQIVVDDSGSGGNNRNQDDDDGGFFDNITDFFGF